MRSYPYPTPLHPMSIAFNYLPARFVCARAWFLQWLLGAMLGIEL